MDDEQTVPSIRWRLDALALSLLMAGASVTIAVAVYGSGDANGTVGQRLAAVITNAIGIATCVFIAGWYITIGAYVGRFAPSLLVCRIVGWALFVLVAASAADLWLPTGGITVYGPGGSVGACISHILTKHLDYPLPVLVLCLAALVSLLLIARQLVFGFIRAAYASLKRGAIIAVRANSTVEFITHRIATTLSWLNRSTPKKIASDNPSLDLIALKPVFDYQPQDLEVTPATTQEDSIPITRPPVIPIESSCSPDIINAENREISDSELASGSYELPPLSLLAEPETYAVADHEQRLRDRAILLEKTFQDFGLNVKVVGIHTGPVITQYEIALETGLRLNKVTTLSDDLALCLGVASVRIVAPLPGRTTVGVEVPNDHRQTVRLKELMIASTAKASRFKLPVFLGKDVEGRPLVYDMSTMPHLLIAGRTGTGKSVCLNTIILSFLFSRTPDECRLLLIDPKKVEFSDYARVPHLMHPVVTDDKKAEAILAWAVDKMEERYELLRKARVRNIASYNELGWDEILKRADPQSEEERAALPRKMPYVVIVVDEVGDLLMSMKKEVESHIIRLAQKSRAAGIHLILATQKPTVDVITGLIKSNLPARVCFQVASRADSAVVLDEKGAEKLLGAGDMLFLQPGTSTIIRGQGAYVDDAEIHRVTGELAQYESNFENELLNLKTKDASGTGTGIGEKLRGRDPLYEQAIEVVIREQRGSTSLLQRTLGIGYGRASRLIDFMAEDGIVGSFNGSNARDVLIAPDEWEAKRAQV